ncbi:MAG: pyridoxal phosphate-dependent aminotransferase [Candidatus Krumholzibacteriia bacterium]
MHEHPESFNEVHLNLNVRGLGVSATVAINDRSNALRRQGRDVFKLGLGQSPFPVPEPVVEALRQNAGQKDYLPVAGLHELREIVAEHHARTFDIRCTADDVLIGPGSKELMFLLQLAYYGDLVIGAPAWVSYAPQARIIGRNIFILPTTIETDWQITAAQLEEFCAKDHGRPRILVLNYPSNPTGRTLSHTQLGEIAEVARENHVVVLSDEIYGKIHHRGKHESIVPLYPEGTIFSGGLSKWCGAGGWRLGLFVFPKSLRWLLEAMAAVASETFTSTSAPIQYAAVRAFQEGPEIERYLVQSRRVLSAIGERLTGLLAKAGADILPPQGAFYLFPDFSPLRERLLKKGIRTGIEMCERLLEDAGVAILPGSAFGRPADEFTARLAYVDFDGKRALEAAESVPLDEALGDGFVHENCGRVVEAVDHIGDWIGAME